ncbi:MAG: SOS response-associated peptidase family protein [Slackia sp.]
MRKSASLSAADAHRAAAPAHFLAAAAAIRTKAPTRPTAAYSRLYCGTLSVWSLRWGYPMPSDGKLVFNTRLERAPFSALWSDSFEKRRCIVPVMAFYESSSSEYALTLRVEK